MDCPATSPFSVPQCDCTSTTGPGWPSPAQSDGSGPAKRLLPQQRQDLAIQVLAGTETVSELYSARPGLARIVGGSVWV